MCTCKSDVYDVVGIGFGPSNLSLAIALGEHQGNRAGHPVKAAFFERQQSFGWHRNMLLPETTMQISFMKDLVTFRNPRSQFSFVNYLHESGRLTQFCNNQDFFPTRQEFHRYLEWVGSSFDDQVSYDSEVLGVTLAPEPCECAQHYLELEIRNGTLGTTEIVNARNISISTGLVPKVPENVAAGDGIWHSSQFLEKLRDVDPADLRNVAVVGGGQSAAEITRYLHATLPEAQVYAIVPSYGYSVADDTPFANQVFDPEAVDDYYFGSDETRDAFWRYHRNTNYSVVDDDIIRDLHRASYAEQVTGERRLHFLNLTRVRAVTRNGATNRVSLHSLIDRETRELDIDALVLATGYTEMTPTGLIGDVDHFCQRDAEGRYRIERDYRLMTDPEFPCGIYLQGGTEHTHGLTSSLLSNVAVRGGEIADSVITRTRADAPTMQRSSRRIEQAWGRRAG